MLNDLLLFFSLPPYPVLGDDDVITVKKTTCFKYVRGLSWTVGWRGTTPHRGIRLSK